MNNLLQCMREKTPDVLSKPDEFLRFVRFAVGYDDLLNQYAEECGVNISYFKNSISVRNLIDGVPKFTRDYTHESYLVPYMEWLAKYHWGSLEGINA